MKYISNSERETMDIAKNIIEDNIGVNSLFFLIGNLGVGKTVFAKGVAEFLEVKEKITSPTFGIKSEYEGLVHYDLYLSEKKIDISSILFEDEEKGVVLIEWANKIPNKLLKKGIQIHITKYGDQRIIEIK